MRVLSAAMVLAIVALVSAGTSVQAQLAPVIGGKTGSLGQPRSLKWTGAGAVGWARDRPGPDLSAAFGLQRDLLNPMLSLIAVHGELYVDARDEGVTPGARARLLSPFGRVGAGATYRWGETGPDLLLSFFHPIRRGGLFADGSVLRVDYLPGRERSFSIGVEKPLLRKARVGRSRPERDHVRLPRAQALRASGAVPPAIATHMATVAEAARHIRLITLPLGPIPAHQPLDSPRIAAVLVPVTRALAAESSHAPAGDVVAVAAVRRYHRALELAFSIAASDLAAVPETPTATGIEIATAARRILLSDVLLPYDRLLGQRKTRDGLQGFGDIAAAAFEGWLHLHATISPTRRDATLRVFTRLVGIMEENRQSALAQWRDNRFVWLPLQYALLPEEHDTQAELDAIVEAAVGEQFTDGNDVSWVVNEQFQYHLSRTIREATDYHVLMTHDFRGIDGTGAPDEMSYTHVLRSYLATMIQRVRNYDRTGRFPTYMIVLDEWFYEVNRGRLWLALLEDPLHYRLTLPPGQRAWQDSIAAAQHALRAAVNASPLLQSQARRYGDAWLRNLIKVHVSITNPADPSFWSRTVIRGLPLPDNMMRDHRKIVFYDISEDDPYRGAAMFTGAGVGEHYANLSWEDRSLLVRGPALLPLKTVVRELLLNQGLPEDELPHALLPRERTADYDARVRSELQRSQQPLRALQLHNDAGFSDKQVNVAKAVLYTLMPPGSVIKIPDSLWNSDFWGAALLGCALRGGRTLIIAPAEGNAPADVLGALGRSHEMLGRLVTAQRILHQDIAAAGGLLRVGMYRSDLRVTDIPEKVRLASVAFDTQPWLRVLFPFQQSVLDGLAEMAARISGMSMTPVAREEFEFDPRPKLHLKANFFASREAWSLIGRSEWEAASWAYLQARLAQVQERGTAVNSFEDFPDAIADVGGGMVKDWYAALEPHTRHAAVFYTLMGSHNQNTRSMVIDAEVGFLISQWPPIIPYIDLIIIIGQTRWIEQPGDLAALLPLDTGLKRRLVQWIRLAL